MSNLSDKEIDRLSREAADSYEPDDSSLSWSKLEQKLTQEMPDRPPDGFRFGRISPYVWGPAVVLLAGISFFFIKNTIYSKDSTRNSQTLNKPVSSSPDGGNQASRNTVHLDSTSSTDAASYQKSSEDQNPETASASKTSETPGTDTKNYSALSDSYSAKNRSGLKSSGSKDMIPGSFAAAGSLASGSSNASSDNLNADAINGSAAMNGSNDNAGNHTSKSQIGLPFVVTSGTGLGKVSGNDSLLNQLAQSKTPIHQKSLHLNRSLNFGFVFGPDYTNAGGIANNQIGNNIGVTLGYYLTGNLSINTGFIYTNKFYWSNAHNYRYQQNVNVPPIGYPGTYAAPPPIDYINGASNIWELPLTLRYDFVHHEKTRFFANAGLSSYFIMKQTYIYFFHSGQNPLAYKIIDDEQSNYWFGIADFSVGFEAEIGKGFSFQAEPFLKLPLQNMGRENLKLTSYGFLLSFKYAPVLSRTKK
jgi:hypothetical protein